MYKCIETYKNINLALWQIGSTPIEPGLKSLAMIFVNRWIRGNVTEINRSPLFLQLQRRYNKLKVRHDKAVKNNDILKEHTVIFTVYSSSPERRR